MTIGYILAFLAIRFNEINLTLNANNPYFILPAPAVTFAILLIPYFDMGRVIYIRILMRKSIFYSDKSHIHHLLIIMGLSHKKITGILVFINTLFIIFAFYMQKFFTIRRLILLMLVIALFLSFIPEFVVRKIKIKKKEDFLKN